MPTGPMTMVGTRVPTDTVEAIARRAGDLGLNPAEWLRMVVDAGLKSTFTLDHAAAYRRAPGPDERPPTTGDQDAMRWRPGGSHV